MFNIWIILIPSAQKAAMFPLDGLREQEWER